MVMGGRFRLFVFFCSFYICALSFDDVVFESIGDRNPAAVSGSQPFPGIALTNASFDEFFWCGDHRCRVYGGCDATGDSDVCRFVYPLPSKFNVEHMEEQARGKSCHDSMYHMDIFIHQFFLSSQFRTLNPEEADFFYAPIYFVCHLFRYWKMGQTKAFLVDAIDYVIQDFPFFNASRGMDHIWSFSYDFGAKYAPYHLIQNGVFLVLAGLLNEDYFNPHKDIVLPPHVVNRQLYLEKECVNVDNVPSPLAFFRGAINLTDMDELLPPEKLYSRGIRQKLYRKFLNDTDVIIRNGHSKDYICELKHSTFCLCLPGFAPWTPRIFETILAGCIPVIISDTLMLPFEDQVNFSSFSVKILEKDVGRLKSILSSIPEEEILLKRQKLAEFRNTFSYLVPSEPGDVFHHLLERLALKASRFRPSVSRDWR